MLDNVAAEIQHRFIQKIVLQQMQDAGNSTSPPIPVAEWMDGFELIVANRQTNQRIDSLIVKDGTWVKATNTWDKDYVPDGRWQASYPYRYVLRNGEVQERTAKIHVERREWRWYWFMWMPWTALKRQSIDVEFDGEVGEQAGSWKGGCIGCGYDMKPWETAEQTLRRMESERVFD